MEMSHSSQLPPLEKDIFSSKGETPIKRRDMGKSVTSTDNVISDYQLKFEQIKKENELVRRQKEESEEAYSKLMDTNNNIQGKLENLEQIFLNKKKDQQN